MADLTTTYMGLLLKNPLIIGSSGLTSSVEKIRELESGGAAAVVLKSIFEEEIIHDIRSHIESVRADSLIYTERSETLDYIDIHIREDTLNNYLLLIKNLKKEVLIPVIASINCITDQEWTGFARKIEEAGADALELNIFLNPADTSDLDFEQTYQNIIRTVLSEVRIPVSVKLSQYFTKPYHFFIRLSGSGIRGMVLFNRFFLPDIDLDSLTLKEADIYSSPSDFNQVLRWMGILSGNVNCSLAASTGIHDSPALIKQILAAADAVQVVSAIYRNGPLYINHMLSELEKWMDDKGFNYIDQFKGMLAASRIRNPAAYERMQFMKYFSGIK